MRAPVGAPAWLLVGLTLVLMVPAAPYRAQQDPAPEGQPPEAEVPLVIPEREKARPNPFPPRPESLAHGQEIFATQCTMCHGSRGDGNGDLVARLGLEMPDLTSPATQRKRTDGEWFYILTQGHGDMPGEGERLPDEWKWDLVNYLRTLAPR